MFLIPDDSLRSQLNGTKWRIRSSEILDQDRVLIFYPDGLLYHSGFFLSDFMVSSWTVNDGVINISQKEIVSYNGKFVDKEMIVGSAKHFNTKSEWYFAAIFNERIADFDKNEGYILFKQKKYLEAYRFFKPTIENPIKNLKIDLGVYKDDCEIVEPIYRECCRNLLSKARECYQNKLYIEAVAIYDELDGDSNDYRFSESIYYCKHPLNKLNDKHPVYKQLYSAHNSYWEKQHQKRNNERWNVVFNDNKNDIKFTEDELAAGYLKKYSEDDSMSFGKHKGIKIKNLIETDFSYLCWCIINSLSFCVSSEILIPIKLREHPLFYQALELNIIKNLVLNDLFCESEMADAKAEAEFQESNPWDDYSERDMIDDAFEGDESNLWNID